MVSGFRKGIIFMQDTLTIGWMKEIRFLASHLMNTGGSFPVVKLPQREADHSPPPIAKVNKAWRFTSRTSSWSRAKTRGQLLLYLVSSNYASYRSPFDIHLMFDSNNYRFFQSLMFKFFPSNAL